MFYSIISSNILFTAVKLQFGKTILKLFRLKAFQKEFLIPKIYYGTYTEESIYLYFVIICSYTSYHHNIYVLGGILTTLILNEIYHNI